MKSSICHSCVIIFLLITSLQVNAQKLALVPIVSGMNAPLDVKNCGDDRLFAAEQGGRIRVINADSTLRPTPFLDISSKIYTGDTEQGLLGMVFSPNYKTNGKFYVHYISLIGGVSTIVVEEYKVSAADSNIADLSSALTILTQPLPPAGMGADMGGNLMFGNDTYLYSNMGDGGVRPNGQVMTTFLGKILRIDVNNSSMATPYVIPPTNPFYNDVTPGLKKEIWAYGVRNPWRSCVDKFTGDLWIADVGQNSFEEIDYQAANAAAGRNYGWNIMEGNACFSPPTGCNMTGITLPIYDYPHSVGTTIIGGYMYRSAQSKALFGTYIYGDFGLNWIDGIKQSGGVLSGSVSHFITAAQASGKPISFGEDRFGDQYVLLYGNGTLYKLQDTSFQRRPKAYFTPSDQGGGSFLFQGLQGRNLTYQWLRDNVIIPGATSPDYTTSVTGTYTLVVTNTLAISDTSDAFSLGALPLSLVSFTAQKMATNKIRLQWETALEQNILGYKILRRQNNEASFSNIGIVASKAVNGTSNSKLDYTFIDSSASRNSKLFYRLEIEHADGSYTYSDIRVISAGNGYGHGFTFSPNPAKGQVQISLDNFTQPVVMVIYDNAGKKVKEQSLNQQNTTIELSGLRGVYIVQLGNKDGTDLTRKKLVIE